jgi:lipoprotein signal peptidase
VVIVSVLLNLRIPGMALVALGAISNLVAIVLNGGYMPADAGAMAALGKTAPTTYSNSAIVAEPVLKPLTDIFALPTWLPFHNVFSVGDVLIAVGVVVVIVAAMRRPVAELQTTWFV